MCTEPDLFCTREEALMRRQMPASLLLVGVVSYSVAVGSAEPSLLDEFRVVSLESVQARLGPAGLLAFPSLHQPPSVLAFGTASPEVIYMDLHTLFPGALIVWGEAV
jgi:hypothetical protein